LFWSKILFFFICLVPDLGEHREIRQKIAKKKKSFVDHILVKKKIILVVDEFHFMRGVPLKVFCPVYCQKKIDRD